MSRIDAWMVSFMGETFWKALRRSLKELWTIPGGAAILTLYMLGLRLLGVDLPWWFIAGAVPLACGSLALAFLIMIGALTAIHQHEQKGKDQ